MDAERQVSRCHLGSETALIYKWLFALEILSKSKYEPLKNIRVLSQGTTPLCTPLLHFACPDSFHGWEKLSIFRCSASKIIEGGANPHPAILHIHSLHFPHLPLSSPPNLHALQKKSSFGRFVLTANHQLLLSWESYLVPSYWQTLSTGGRHRAVAQGAAALKTRETSSPVQQAWKWY